MPFVWGLGTTISSHPDHTRQPVDLGSVPDRLRRFAEEFDRFFGRYLHPSTDVPGELSEAMRYSALGPGKRLRPYLVVRCCEIAGGDRGNAWPIAAAVECVHAFSLIHDDLPAMDDDDLRRGRPTCHKRFGEALAILAGDALVVLAFELVAAHTPDAGIAVPMIRELAAGVGWAGMIGGQTADVIGQNQPPSLESVRYIHERKTARLFESACKLGAMIGQGGEDEVILLGQYGRHLGQAFQIADDLLDLTATAETVGKQTGKDIDAGKQTYPRCVGMEESRRAAREAVEAAIGRLDRFGESAEDLRALATYVADRTY